MQKQKVALITGITGQDGAYLAEYLLKKDMLFMEPNEEVHCSIPKELIISIWIHMWKTAILFCITAILLIPPT